MGSSSSISSSRSVRVSAGAVSRWLLFGPCLRGGFCAEFPPVSNQTRVGSRTGGTIGFSILSCCCFRGSGFRRGRRDASGISFSGVPPGGRDLAETKSRAYGRSGGPWFSRRGPGESSSLS